MKRVHQLLVMKVASTTAIATNPIKVENMKQVVDTTAGATMLETWKGSQSQKK